MNRFNLYVSIVILLSFPACFKKRAPDPIKKSNTSAQSSQDERESSETEVQPPTDPGSTGNENQTEANTNILALPSPIATLTLESFLPIIGPSLVISTPLSLPTLTPVPLINNFLPLSINPTPTASIVFTPIAVYSPISIGASPTSGALFPQPISTQTSIPFVGPTQVAPTSIVAPTASQSISPVVTPEAPAEIVNGGVDPTSTPDVSHVDEPTETISPSASPTPLSSSSPSPSPSSGLVPPPKKIAAANTTQQRVAVVVPMYSDAACGAQITDGGNALIYSEYTAAGDWRLNNTIATNNQYPSGSLVSWEWSFNNVWSFYYRDPYDENRCKGIIQSANFVGSIIGQAETIELNDPATESALTLPSPSPSPSPTPSPSPSPSSEFQFPPIKITAGTTTRQRVAAVLPMYKDSQCEEKISFGNALIYSEYTAAGDWRLNNTIATSNQYPTGSLVSWNWSFSNIWTFYYRDPFNENRCRGTIQSANFVGSVIGQAEAIE